MTNYAKPPKCDCGRTAEPTAALAVFYPFLRGKSEVTPWTCRDCRVTFTDWEDA